MRSHSAGSSADWAKRSAGSTPLRALETRKPRWSPNVSFTVSLAWALVAIMGVPALAIATWGLAGGYSFKYLPFLLVPYAIPFAVAPLLAVLLIQWPRRLRAFSVPAGVLVAVLALGASAIAVLALIFTIPLSLLDDSGHAMDNFLSLLVAGIFTLAYVAGSVAFVIVLISGARAWRGGPPRGPFLRMLALATAGTSVVVGTAAAVGALNIARLDAHGIPVGPAGDSWLATRTESSIIYPGADGVSKVVAGEERQLTLSKPAAARTVFFTHDPPAQIPAWYADQLGKSGWKPVLMIGTAIEEKNWAFERGNRELFELFLYRASGYGTFPDQAQHPGERRFETDYVVFAPGEPHA